MNPEKDTVAKKNQTYSGTCICGKDIYVPSNHQGRFPEHCSEHCRKLSSALNTVELYLLGGKSYSGKVVVDEADSFYGRATTEACGEMRGRLFQIVNSRCLTKGRKIERQRDAKGKFRRANTREHASAKRLKEQRAR